MLAPTMPSSSITYSSATTRGRDASGARSDASARPAVCVVCRPAPASTNASAAATWPATSCTWVSPASRISANGMIASPPNMPSVPNQTNGTRRQPRKLRCTSERKPISARNGAATSGRATINATSHAPTPNSRIITRLSVPTIRAVAMPTATWNSAKRTRRGSGRSGDAASAKGRNRAGTSAQLMPGSRPRRVIRLIQPSSR